LKSCNSCGVQLLGTEKLYFEDSANGQAPNSKSVKPQIIKNVKKISEAKGKQISNIQLFYLILGLVLFGFIVLYSSGVMDSSSQTSAGETGNLPPAAGANLSNINDIRAQEELVKNTPGNNENLLKLAHLLNDSGFFQKAIDRYQQYLKVMPKDADVIVDMGVCYFQLGKHAEAIGYFKKGIEINPKHQIAHLNLGVVNSFGLKNRVEAEKWWKKAVELDPNSDIGKKAQEFLNQK